MAVSDLLFLRLKLGYMSLEVDSLGLRRFIGLDDAGGVVVKVQI